MSRTKGGTVTHARHRKVVKAAKGYYGRRKNTFKVATSGGRQGQPIRNPRPQEPQAEFPRAVDPADQRGCACA